jgi:tetratricopeptide (TPR) repeat protein
MVLRELGRNDDAKLLLKSTRELDRLDWWARHLEGEKAGCDLQVQLDLAHDYARAGFLDQAIDLLQRASAEARDLPDQSWGALPMVHFTLGWLEEKRGHPGLALAHFKRAGSLPADYCFPARLEEVAILKAAMQLDPAGARAPYYLGNLLYDRRRHEEAILLWERAAKLDGSFSIAWRNLGIGYFNVSRQAGKARKAYDRAFDANPADARLLYERDQLWKRLGEKPGKRLRLGGGRQPEIGPPLLVRCRQLQRGFSGNERSRVQRNDLLLGFVVGKAWPPVQGPEAFARADGLRAKVAGHPGENRLLCDVASGDVIVR